MLADKACPGTNTLAYLSQASVMNKLECPWKDYRLILAEKAWSGTNTFASLPQALVTHRLVSLARLQAHAS